LNTEPTTRTSHGPLLASVLLVLSVSLSWPAVPAHAALQVDAAGASPQPRIVNGLLSNEYETVGALLNSANPATARAFCSGALIGCRTFLTASHCVDGDLNPAHYGVYLQHAGVFAVSSVAVHPSYTDATFPRADVAILKLAAPVTSITPTPFNQTYLGPYVPFPPREGVIAGFGQTSGAGAGFGIKRQGKVQTASCSGTPSGTTNTELVCWDFTNPIGPVGEDSNTCYGDSGGPLLLDLGAGAVVAAVTSGGTSASCLPTDHSYDANVENYSAFIADQLGADSTLACGTFAKIGDANVTVEGHQGTLDSSVTSRTFDLALGTDVDQLRISLNSEDPSSPITNFDLYVRHGAPATTMLYDCATVGSGPFGYCQIDAPPAGVWYVLVQRVTGAGQFQVTDTVIGGAVPSCGNDVREPGEECDGTDDATCPGQCQAGCSCPSTCTSGDLLVRRLRVDAKRVRSHLFIFNDGIGGNYDGLDPRNGLSFGLDDGVNTLTLTIPAWDVGWDVSKPEKRKFKWKGLIDGVKRVKLIDKSTIKGYYKFSIVGKEVPGASAIDQEQAQIRLNIDSACIGQ